MTSLRTDVVQRRSGRLAGGLADRLAARLPRGRASRWAWPLAGLGGVGALDLVQDVRSWPVPVMGALDEPAHLITAALVLAALRRGPLPRWAVWAMAGSVGIDADHVPLYLGVMPTTTDGGRPVTHCLLTAAVLLAGAAVTRGRLRTALGGLSAGVCLHFVRDLGTGPGVPLLWPLDGTNVRVPYAVYYAVLVLLAGTAALRRRHAMR